MDSAVQTSDECVFPKLKLKSPSYDEHSTERGQGFWCRPTNEMKFKVESEWHKTILLMHPNEKPNFGMGNMDSKHEQVAGMKLELTGPLIDSYLRKIAKSIYQKLSRSNATGLMAPVRLFIPWQAYRHLLVLACGYGGDLTTQKKGEVMVLTFTEFEKLFKVFSPARFEGENFLKHRLFRKSTENNKIKVYKGRAAVIVTENTPFSLKYSMKDNRLECAFYVQRYTQDDFAIDASLQALINFKS